MALSSAMAGMTSALSSLLPTIGSITTGIINNSSSRKRMQQAYYWQSKLQEEAHRMQMESALHNYNLQQQGLIEGPTNARTGYEKAGFNPILAVNQGGQFSQGVSGVSPSTASISSQDGNFPDLGNTLINAYKTLKLEKAQTVSNIKLQDAQTNSYQADASYKEQLATSEEVKRAGYQLDNLIKHYQSIQENFKANTQEFRFAKEMEEMASRTKLNLETAMFTSYNSLTNRIIANAQQENAATNIKNYRISKEHLNLSKNTNIQEQKYRQEHPVYDFVDRWSGTFGRLLGGAGYAASGYANVSNALNNKKSTYTETAKFNSNGVYQGHTRTTRRRRR